MGGADFARFGLPSESEFLAAYCRQTDRAVISNLDFLAESK
jgi:hypothetical protein